MHCERCGKPGAGVVFSLRILERRPDATSGGIQRLYVCAACARPLEDQLKALLEPRHDATSGARRAGAAPRGSDQAAPRPVCAVR